MTLPTPKHVLISRVDNIGDVVLTLGVATLLKAKFPAVQITFLGRAYVRGVVEQCPAVDNFLSADEWLALPNAAAVAQLRALDIDTCLHAFPRRRIAWLVYRAGIRYRIGTARRWYHLLTCNLRLHFSRANSGLHEAVLNCHLLQPFGISLPISADELNGALQLTPATLTRSPYLSSTKFNLIVHPLTNGNTREWPLSYFSELLAELPADEFQIFVTGSAQEREKLQPLIRKHPHVTDLSGQLSLPEFLTVIAQADGLVANSTGPLHLAAAMGIRTLGLFPLEHSMSPSRWRPLGSRAEVISAPEALCPPTPCNNHDCRCIRAVSVAAVVQRLQAWVRPDVQ